MCVCVCVNVNVYVHILIQIFVIRALYMHTCILASQPKMRSLQVDGSTVQRNRHMHICVCVCVCVNGAHFHTNICNHNFVHTYMHTCTTAQSAQCARTVKRNMHIHMCVYLCLCVNANVYEYAYSQLCAYIHTYITAQDAQCACRRIDSKAYPTR
jgi:hypothetical protein